MPSHLPSHMTSQAGRGASHAFDRLQPETGGPAFCALYFFPPLPTQTCKVQAATPLGGSLYFASLGWEGGGALDETSSISLPVPGEYQTHATPMAPACFGGPCAAILA